MVHHILKAFMPTIKKRMETCVAENLPSPTRARKRAKTGAIAPTELQLIAEADEDKEESARDRSAAVGDGGGAPSGWDDVDDTAAVSPQPHVDSPAHPPAAGLSEDTNPVNATEQLSVLKAAVESMAAEVAAIRKTDCLQQTEIWPSHRLRSQYPAHAGRDGCDTS